MRLGKTRPVAPGSDDAKTFRFYRMGNIRRKFCRDFCKSFCSDFLLQAAHLEMMGALRYTDLIFETDDLHPVFAQRAVHRRATFDCFLGPGYQHIGNVGMYAQITGFQHFQLGFALLHQVGGFINALD